MPPMWSSLLVSVIADISLDHQKFLGNTVTEIAREKAGIIRPGGVVVTLPQQPAANDVIGNTILETDATGISAVQYVPPVSPASAEYHKPAQKSNRSQLSAGGHGEADPCRNSAVGRHQLRNIALAIAAAEELGKKGFTAITAESIERGIRDTHWPGPIPNLQPTQRLARNRARCGAQSGRSMGPALRPFGAI